MLSMLNYDRKTSTTTYSLLLITMFTLVMFCSQGGRDIEMAKRLKLIISKYITATNSTGIINDTGNIIPGMMLLIIPTNE